MSVGDHRRLMSAMRSDARLRDFEARVRDLGGVERVLLFNGELIDYDGRPALLTISHDITERRQAEQALLSREQQLTGIVETAMDAIITIDAQQKVVMFNRAASEMFGLPAPQALGHPLDEFIPAELLERHRAGMKAFTESGRERVAIGQGRRLYGMRTNGERFPFEAAISRQGEGERMTMTAVIRDLTDRLAAGYVTDRFQEIMPHAPSVPDASVASIRLAATGAVNSYRIPWTKTGIGLGI